jgi:hypothetical protein
MRPANASGRRDSTQPADTHKPESAPELDLLTVKEAAALLRRTPNTLVWWRNQGTGPVYVQQGHMPPLYRRDDLIAWIRAHRVEPSWRSPRRARRQPR